MTPDFVNGLFVALGETINHRELDTRISGFNDCDNNHQADDVQPTKITGHDKL